MSSEVTRTFDLLDYILRLYPRSDALAGKQGNEWHTISTEAYVRNSRRFALGLLAMGVSKGDRIATVTNNRPEWNYADMGITMAGAVHVPIYPTIGEDEYQYILTHSGSSCLIAGDGKLYEKLAPVVKGIATVKELFTFEEVPGVRSIDAIMELGEKNREKLQEKLDGIMASINPEELATIIYTSGTTGVPKGVMLSHRNLVSNFTTHAKMHDLGYQHRVISFLPLCHVYERSVNYHFQYKGMGVYYVGNLAQIVSAIKEVKPHMFNSVPRLLEKVYDGFVAKGRELSGLKKSIYFWALNLTRHFEYNKKYGPWMGLKIRVADKLVYSKWRAALGGNIVYAVSGGASLQPKIARTLGMAGMLNLEGYGLTETSPVIAVNNPKLKLMKIGTVGPVLEGFTVKIASDGEILCKGPGLMMGYYKSPEMTAEVIDSEGWFHTGDIGTFEEGVYLKITDRKKEMFKLSGGKYIAPQMIENKLKASTLIEQAMVIGANQKFASALISPNFVLLHDWCTQHHIHFENNRELIRMPEVVALMQKEVREVNKTLGLHEEIKRFRLVCAEWSPATGELSPTLKLRRNVITARYQELIDDIYSVQKNGGD